MDCPVGGMEGLDIVKSLRDCSHLYHTIAIISIQPLDFGTSVTRVSEDYADNLCDDYLFWNQTWTWRELRPGISRESRSRCAASG
jgi:hypothetical protein